MKLKQVITEANVAAKIKDPNTIRQIALAVRHDSTMPRHKIAKLGVKPSEEELLNFWSEMLDTALSNTRYGNISQDGKFDQWLTRLYANGHIDYEDLSGESGDALGAWKALSIRRRLRPEHQDFNKFKSLRQLQKTVQDSAYREELRRIANAAVIEKHKRERKEIQLYSDKRFEVTMPFNYGSCYTFNNAEGVQANFCTGGSRGLEWFQNYAPRGPVVMITDKNNIDNQDGKWQFHAETDQLVRADQERRHDLPYNDERFAELFPGLMRKIVASMQAKAAEIKDASKEISPPDGYDLEKSIAAIKNKFPNAYNSVAEEPKEEEESGPGVYVVKHRASGKIANISGESKEDVLRQIQERYPNVTADDFEISKKKEQPEQA